MCAPKHAGVAYREHLTFRIRMTAVQGKAEAWGVLSAALIFLCHFILIKQKKVRREIVWRGGAEFVDPLSIPLID